MSSLLLLTTTILGCQSEDEAPITGDESALTQSRIPKLSNATMEKLRADYEASAKGEADFFGYAAAFKWSSTHSLAGGLSAEQKSFLATKLIHTLRDGSDRIPYSVDLRAVDVDKSDGLAASELRLAAQAGSAVDADVGKVLTDGRLVVRLEPAKPVPGAARTAGAIMVVDMEKREALLLYGRRGPTPFRADCTVTKMLSYEWEEALSKDEYPSVNTAEIPLLGDVLLDIGANGTLSNGEAKSEGEDYGVVLTRTGSAVEVVANGPSYFRGKLLVEGTTGAVWGDNDGNGRPNKAAELECKVH